jgi:cytochrome P460
MRADALAFDDREFIRRLGHLWEEEIMRTRTKLILATTVGTIVGLTATAQVRAGADNIAFPADYAKGVIYMTLDRPENKQVRDYMTSQAALDAAKKGAPLPNGTVIIVVQYAAQLDAQGNPAKDASGRMIKTNNIVGYNVMEKRTGWGAEYPEIKRNGEWEYQVFRADKTPNPNANLNSCFMCHKPQAEQDYVFSYDKLKIAAQ